MAEYTKTQRQLLEVLNDGVTHSTLELIPCLWDGDINALRWHIHILKKKLPQDQTIIAVPNVGYRMVRLLPAVGT